MMITAKIPKSIVSSLGRSLKSENVSMLNTTCKWVYTGLERPLAGKNRILDFDQSQNYKYILIPKNYILILNQ